MQDFVKGQILLYISERKVNGSGKHDKRPVRALEVTVSVNIFQQTV